MSKKTTVSGILLVLLVLATTPLLGTDKKGTRFTDRMKHNLL